MFVTISYLNVHFDVYFDRAILLFLKTTPNTVDEELVNKLHQRISTDELDLVTCRRQAVCPAGVQPAGSIRPEGKGGKKKKKTKGERRENEVGGGTVRHNKPRETTRPRPPHSSLFSLVDYVTYLPGGTRWLQ